MSVDDASSVSLSDVAVRLERVARDLESQRVELDVRLRELKSLVLGVRAQPQQRLFEFREAAKLLGVAPKTVSRMVASGELLPRNVRGKRLISIEEIDRVSRPPRMSSSGATEERVRFDGAKALAELKALRKGRRQ